MNITQELSQAISDYIDFQLELLEDVAEVDNSPIASGHSISVDTARIQAHD